MESTGSTNRLAVMTSISTFTSFVIGVAGDLVDVSSLVPVGASVEDYQPTPQDLVRLRAVNVLFENGHLLETWLQRTIDNAGNKRLQVVVLGAGFRTLAGNPHLWMDPEFARRYVRMIRDTLSRLDAPNLAAYDRNAAAYDKKLAVLTDWIRSKIDTIPPAQRTMITFHGAFDYYNARFGLRTLGVIERSPGKEPSPSDLAALVTLARENHVRAIFAEPQFNPKLARALAESAGIKLVENLYDDTLGTTLEVADYISMMHYDTETIVRALGGKP